MNKKTKVTLSKFYPLILGVTLFVSIIIAFAILNPNADSALLLLEFEEKYFAGLDITEVDTIKSGDVEIRLSLQAFAEMSVSMDKQVYKYHSSDSHLLTYVFFDEGRDGELVEYYMIMRFNEYSDEWLERWRW